MIALRYDVTANYVKGPDVLIADALSRVSPQPASANGQLPEIHVHHITQNLPASLTDPRRDKKGPHFVIAKGNCLRRMASEKRKVPSKATWGRRNICFERAHVCSGPELQRISSIKSNSASPARNTRERPRKNLYSSRSPHADHGKDSAPICSSLEASNTSC